jgi:hypothetical protein
MSLFDLSFIITDTHLVFYYEGVEDHKVPIRSISKVTIEENELICDLTNINTGQKFGELRFQTIAKGRLIKNIIETISKLMKK